MRVLVFEQFYLGHHTHYLSCILPRLAALVDDVVVAITTEARRSEEFRTQLAPLEGRVRFDTAVPGAIGLDLRERGQLFRNLTDAIDRVRPDYVLVPTADAQTTGMVMSRLGGRERLPRGTVAEAAIHFGLGVGARGWKHRLRDRLKHLTLRLSTWDRVHFVNRLFFEQVRNGPKSLADRSALLPDPIPPNPGLSREESRRRLGVPEQGRYVGLAACLDRRKAIPELLAAYRAVATDPDDRLLLAGRLDRTFRALIDRDYADLVRRGRVILLDRFLSADEFQWALTALDIVCTPYPRFGHLSGTVLHGVAAGRPILANDYGWSAETVRRFQLGWVCDVLKPDDFAQTLRQALAECNRFRVSEATRRLMEFHSPENFAESWMTRLRAINGHQPYLGYRTWDWVLSGRSDNGGSVRPATPRVVRRPTMPVSHG